MKTQLTLIAALSLLVSACNRVIDIQPEWSEAVPVSAISAVREKFPNATNMVFKTLEKNRVWQVDFNQSAKKYKGAVTDTTILTAFLRTSTVPDSIRALIEVTSARGGQFTGEFKQQVVFNKGDFRYNVYLADYTWRGKTYSVGYSDFKIVGSTLSFVNRTLSLNNPISFLYTTGDQAVLPEKVRAYLDVQGLSAAGRPYDEEPISVLVTESGQKRYVLSARKERGGSSFSFTIAFDNSGDYLYAGSIPTSDGTTGVDGATRLVSNKIDDVPTSIRSTFVDDPDYAGFTFERFETINLYSRVTNIIVLTSAAKENWLLYYNDQGVLVNRSLGLLIN